MRGYQMTMAAAVFGLLAACTDYSSKPEKQRNVPEQTQEKPPVSNELSAEQKTTIQDYVHATRCSALTNIIKILVDSEVIVKPGIVDNVDTASIIWHDRAGVAGKKLGKTEREVRLDIDQTQFDMLQPLKSLPEQQAAARIQGLVKSAGQCGD